MADFSVKFGGAAGYCLRVRTISWIPFYAHSHLFYLGIDIDYLSRDVVGMVGVPIEVHGYKLLPEDELTLVFEYDPAMLECEETDLRVLWYNQTEQPPTKCRRLCYFI